jgi:hypothetical protein
MSKIFQKLEQEAFRAGINPRTEESRKWFMEKASDLGKINRRRLMNEAPLIRRNREKVGAMMMFFYDPKLKDQLPYYDRFPLVIVVGPAEGGFYGLNLHYIPPVYRAKLLDQLMDFTNNTRYDETTRFKLKYDLLNRVAGMRWFKPCFKHYLDAHVASQFAFVPAPEWEIATFLPTAMWKKAKGERIYKDSRRLAYGR